MKKGISAFVLLTLWVYSLPAQGILDRLEKRVKDKVNQQINQKAHEKQDSISRNANAYNNDSDSLDDSAKLANQSLLMSLFGLRPCNAQDQYSFSSKAVIDMYNTGKSEEDSFSMRFIWFFNETRDQMGIEFFPWSQKMEDMKGSKTVIDMRDTCMVTLRDADGKKQMVTMKYSDLDKIESEDSAQSKTPVKTGKTKMIDNQLCYEYVLDDEDTYQQMWVESAKTETWDKNLKNWNSSVDPLKNSAAYGQFMDFFPKEMMSKNKATEQVTYLFLRSVIKGKTTMSTVDYSKY